MLPSRPWYTRKRVLVPLVVALWLAGSLAHALLPALFLDAAAVEAARVADGVRAQLVAGEGRRAVLCASARVDVPPERLWAVITDYERYPQVFPMLTEARTTRGADGTCRLDAVARTPVGAFPFSTLVRHDETPARRTASWDQPGGALVVNRGAWTVTPAPEGAQLTYRLELEVAGWPRALVNAAALRLAPAVIGDLIAAARSPR